MRTPSRLLSPRAIAEFCLALALGSCGGGDVTLPPDGEPASITILDGDRQSGRVGETLERPLLVQVSDARGEPVPGATVVFEFSQAGPGAAVVPDQKATNSDGQADTRLVLGTTVGQQAGQARVIVPEGREPIVAPFSAEALSENANNMAPVAGLDQTGHVGQPLDDRLVVEVTDGFGNPVAGVPITWTAEGGGTVSEGLVPTDEDGRSRVDRVLGPAVGQQTTVATSEGLAGSPVVFTHTAVAGDASRLTVVSGNGQTAEAGTLLPEPMVVRLVDAEGNGVPNTAVTWVIASGGGSVSPQNTTTDGDGRTSAGWTLGSALGEQRADAVVSGVGVATFRATATSGAPASLVLRTQPSGSARNGIPLSRQPVVQVRDANGNDAAVAGVEVVVSLNGGGELNGTLRQTTDASGQATFDDLSISGAPGPRTLVFQAVGYAQVTSDVIDLQAIGTTTTITGDSPDPSGAGGTVTVGFRVASEGPVPSGTVTVSDGVQSCTGTLFNGAGSCTLDLMTVGARTLTATYAGGPGLNGSSDTESHTVTAVAPPPPASTTTTITTDTPDPSESGSQVLLSVRVTSGAGTPTGTVNVTVSGGVANCSIILSNGEGSCQLTLDAVGERTFTASYVGGPGFAGSSDTESHTVTADTPPPPDNNPPAADYNWTCSGLTCQFTDASRDSDGAVTGWRWDFGHDGATSAEQNPSHTFPAAGTYTVTLTATDDDGATDPSSAQVTVQAPPPDNQPPTAAFTWDCDELECDFDNDSDDPDGRITDFLWEFGDGTTSTNRNPDHEYAAGGDYQVTLTVTDNDDATGRTTQTVTVTAPPPPNQPPTAAFTESCSELTCSFSSAGSIDPDGSIVGYSWNFGDGGTSTEPNPSHTYASGGTYTVRLEVRDNDDATDDETRQVTVTAPPPPNQAPTAAFDAPSCTVGQPCSFTDRSTDPDGTIATRTWNFPEAEPSGSGDPNPSVTFASEGDKAVTLTVTDDDGATNTATQTVTVIAAPPPESGVLGLRTEPPTAVPAGQVLAPEPEVELLSASGDPLQVEGVTVSAVPVPSDAAILQGTTSLETDGNGRVRFENLSIQADPGSTVIIAFTAAGFTEVDSPPILIASE